MRTTTARFDMNIKQLAAAVLLIAAAGSTFAANVPAEGNQATQTSAQQATQPSKSAIKRQEIQKKVANREPLTYEETLYLR